MDKLLREHQAGFSKDISCPDKIAALRIIVKQSIEWKSLLYINYIDLEKAFNSEDRNCLWKIVRHHGIPNKYLCISHQGNLTGHGVQGTSWRRHVRKLQCVDRSFTRLSCVPFPVPSCHRLGDERDNKGERNGIQWTLYDQLDDLDFADDFGSTVTHPWTDAGENNCPSNNRGDNGVEETKV